MDHDRTLKNSVALFQNWFNSTESGPLTRRHNKALHPPKAEEISRRALLKAAAALSLVNPSVIAAKKVHVVVVGAGAFGGWSALHLLRRGAQVTLIDAWGPGNSRASSGGETRIIRALYPERVYVEMANRSLRLWQENERRWNRKLYHPTGFLRMAGADDQFERSAAKVFREQRLDFEELSVTDAARRYPQVNFQGVKWVLFEKNAGYLLARQACQAVLEMFQREGGHYQQLAVPSPLDVAGDIRQIVLSDASRISADQYVFACGPWLGKLFPDVIGDLIKPTRQEVFFFGTPAGDSSFSEARLPAWSDGDSNFYGIPANEWRGFKIASHRRGPLFDPTNGDRMPTAEGLQNVRNFLEHRFPSLKTAPLLETRVCQYENTPDEHFIIDRHPRARNVWLVGGGSGHGFKHGPAVGEWVSDFVLERKAPERFFNLARFHKRALLIPSATK